MSGQPITKTELTLWLEGYLQKEAVNAPEISALAMASHDFICQMHELFMGHDFEHSTGLELKIWKGLNAYLMEIMQRKKTIEFRKSISIVRD